MGSRQRSHRQRPRPHPRRHPGRLRQGARLSLAEALTREHPWLTFCDADAPGDWLSLTLDPIPWQQALVAQNARWYPGVDAPQVAAAFVLQYLLQIPAHTLAYAAGLADAPPEPEARAHGWAAQLRFTLGPNHVPDRVRLPRLSPTGGPGSGLALAEREYRAVAEPVAAAYPAIAKLGSATRAGLVTDMWRQAVARGRAVERESCCFLYVMPGCHECGGCPRLGR
ncbi:MAG: hypothetical protein IPM00_09455 [Tetrasphaera sp.]|nr:hypothetical protein [Tetrasphaera sp.]